WLRKFKPSTSFRSPCARSAWPSSEPGRTIRPRASSLAPRLQSFEQASQNALGQENDKNHQQYAVDQIVPADGPGAEADAQDFRQQDGDNSADGRPERHIEATDDDGKDHLQGYRNAAHRVGRDEHLVLAVK